MTLKDLLMELNKLSPELDNVPVTITQGDNRYNCETEVEKIIVPSSARNYILICDY